MQVMTICKNWELNFKCTECGAGVYNATIMPTVCEICGNDEFNVVHPINSRKELKKHES